MSVMPINLAKVQTLAKCCSAKATHRSFSENLGGTLKVSGRGVKGLGV